MERLTSTNTATRGVRRRGWVRCRAISSPPLARAARMERRRCTVPACTSCARLRVSCVCMRRLSARTRGSKRSRSPGSQSAKSRSSGAAWRLAPAWARWLSLPVSLSPTAASSAWPRLLCCWPGGVLPACSAMSWCICCTSCCKWRGLCCRPEVRAVPRTLCGNQKAWCKSGYLAHCAWLPLAIARHKASVRFHCASGRALAARSIKLISAKPKAKPCSRK